MNDKTRTLMIAGIAGVLSALATSPVIPQDNLDVTLEVNAPGDALPLYLEVFVNGESTELIAEFSQDPRTGKISAPRSELIEVGIKVPAIRRGRIALDKLPGLDYVYDPAAQTIAFTARAEALLPEVISANRRSAPVTPDKSFGAVLNYDAIAGFGEGADSGGLEFNRLSLALNGWVFSPIGHVRGSGIASTTPDGDPEFLRLNTTYEYNAPGTAITFAAGDVVSSSLSWGRSVRMGGVQLRREFNLRNDLVTEPLLSFSGAAAVPSTVDVFVDNNRVFSGRTDQGPYRFEDIPIYNGAGDAVVVIRDENGNVIKREVPFFSSRNLLKKGVFDYSIELGKARDGYGQTSNDYSDDTLYSASLRFGLTNRVTLQGHVEGKSDLQMFGLGAAFVLGNRAEITLAGGHSNYRGQTGQFAFGTLRMTAMGVGIEASVLRSTDGFTDLAYATAADFLGAGTLTTDQSLLEFPRSQDVLSLTLPAFRDGSNLGFSFVNSQREASTDRIVSASYGRTLKWRNASLSISTAHDLVSDDTRFSAYLNIPTGNNSFTQLSTSTSRETGSGQGLTLVRALGDAVGDYGYQGQLELGEERAAWQVAASIRSRHGRAEAALRQSSGHTSGHARFDGSVVFLGGRFATGNQIHDGFAIVDAGVEDVSVYLQNREVVRTGRSGRALVSGLSSYAPNRISLNVDELPKDATYNITAMDVVPARRSGVVVDFGGSDGADTALVVLRDPGGNYLPVGSQVELNGAEFVVGYDGAAYLEGLKRSNTARVRTSSGTCTARFDFAAGGGVQTIIDPVVCQ
ncbi:MAG: fimbria/pilus outer membrane usher protein [Rhodobacter sp.]|nr:fimbria/pilus outer membrane usher protein [Rhodobacter sp.]